MLLRAKVVVVFFLGGQSVNQEDYRDDQPDGEQPVHCKAKNGIQAMPAGMIKDEARNRQGQHERGEEPARTHSEFFW